MNPAPDMDIYSLTPHYFEWAVKHMADMAIRLAKEPRSKMDVRRGEFLLGRREQSAQDGAGAHSVLAGELADVLRAHSSAHSFTELSPQGRI
jgi:hypothetical protein